MLGIINELKYDVIQLMNRQGSFLPDLINCFNVKTRYRVKKKLKLTHLIHRFNKTHD